MQPGDLVVLNNTKNDSDILLVLKISRTIKLKKLICTVLTVNGTIKSYFSNYLKTIG